MDFIRQLIMCRADMTVEWAAPYPDALGNEHHIDGYGVPHTCTKWVSRWLRACERRIETTNHNVGRYVRLYDREQAATASAARALATAARRGVSNEGKLQ